MTNPMTPSTHAKRLARLLALCAVALPFAASAATLTWTGGGGTPFNWSDKKNWGDQTVQNDDDLVFTGAVGSTNVNDLAGFSLGSLTFTGTSAWTLGVGTDKATNAISLSDGISLEGTGSVTIASDLTLTADQTFSNTATNNRTLLLGANDSGLGAVIDIGTHNLTVHATSTATGNNVVTFGYGGNLIGSGDLIKTGGGVLMLRVNGSGSGYPSFTGNVLVNEGLVRAMHAGALGSGAGTTTVASGATLGLQANTGTFAELITVGGSGVYYATDKVYRGALALHSNLTINRLLTLSSTTDIGFRYADTISTISAGIAESATGSGLNKVGSWADPSAGFLKLTGNSLAYTGATTVKGGGLIINGTHGSASNRVSGYAVTYETLSQATSGVTGGITSRSVLAGTGTVYLKAAEQIIVSGASTSLRANLAPGDVTAATDVSNFTSTIGTFTVNAGDAGSGVTFGDNSQFSVQIGTTGTSDRLAITNGGRLSITGDSLLSITGTLDSSYTYTIAQFGSIAGTFSQVTGLSEGWSVVYNATSIDLVYGAIPEPSTTAFLAALSTLGFVATRRRRSSSR